MIDLARCTVVVEGLDHPEGVCVDGGGTLYAGGESGQVYRVDLEARAAEQVASTGGFLLGICADGDGLLYGCDLNRHEVLRIDPASGAVDVYSRGTDALPMQTPNWAVFDDAGALYVTDSGEWKQDDGRIYRIAPGGATEVWSTGSRRFPNGACLSADGRSLLVAESLMPGVVRVPIGADGAAGEPELACGLPGTVPDGVLLDVEGNLYVTCYRPDRVYTVSPAGDVEVLVEDPEGTVLAAPTNGVFVGETLVLANLGRWHLTSVELGVRGLPLRYPTLVR